VTVDVSAEVAANGGTFSDSDGNEWTYDPSSCTASQSSSCSAAGSLDFNDDEATCYFFCAGGCPGCIESCTLTAVSVSGGGSGADAGVSPPTTSCEQLEQCCVKLGESTPGSPCEEVVTTNNTMSCAAILNGLVDAGDCSAGL
jgi:hypothetical protein